MARRRRAESDLKLNVEQMTSLKVELEECKTDKQRLMTLNDSLEADKQVGDVITAATCDTRSSWRYLCDRLHNVADDRCYNVTLHVLCLGDSELAVDVRARRQVADDPAESAGRRQVGAAESAADQGPGDRSALQRPAVRGMCVCLRERRRPNTCSVTRH